MVISWTSAKGAWPGTGREGRRNRSKAEIEERRKAALIRRAGYVPNSSSLLRMIDEAGIPYNRRQRPLLQVATYTWGSTNNEPVGFSTGGSVYNMTNFPFGSAESQRHTNQTIVYKMLLNMRVFTASSQWARCMRYNMYWWLIYDVGHSNTAPSTDDIFEKIATNCPNLWMVKREMVHRFIVKKKWKTCLTVTGFDVTKAAPNGAFPGNVFVDQRKFFRRLGVRTDWGSGQSGEVAGIKSGALYLIGAPSYDFNVQAYAKFKMYFKSVGNR